MNEIVKNVVCPNCASATTLPDHEASGVCPHCGHAVFAAGAALPAGAGAPEPPSEATVSQSDAEDDLLIADLKEALGFDAVEPRPGAPGADPRAVSRGSVLLGGISDDSLVSGTRLGDFEILAEIGRGGMGIVYRARQVSLGREVALKILPGWARHGQIAVQRFKAEAQAAARLHHTNVVSIYAQGEFRGQYYYAMELVDGVGLDTVIRSRPDLISSTRARASSSVRLPSHAPAAAASAVELETPPAAEDDGAATEITWTREDYRHMARMFAEVAEALHAAHEAGIIHRDIKPHNLLLDAANRLHVTDFGLARLTSEPHLTASGEVMGTPAYLSPEQIRGEADVVDRRTDIYALGVTMYEVLTRRKPFAGESRAQMMHYICEAEPTSLRQHNAQVPLDLETIVLRAIEKEPSRRHATGAELAEDLQRFAEGRPILSRRATPVEKAIKWVRRHKALSAAAVSAAAVIVLAAGLAWHMHATRRERAQALARAAYEQLVYVDYRTPDGDITPQLRQARALGARGIEARIADVLWYVGQDELPMGLQQAEQTAASYPADPRSVYLLAWLQRRECDPPVAHATLARAATLGDPVTAAGWFFRGLAIHFDEPDEAAVAYRAAIAQRAQRHAFFPQAVLQLARARNQQLYATRSLDGFDEAAGALRQLIDQGHYRAYPYYLLSITHRLAAEIYRGSEGTRGDAEMAEHYDHALHWAREGQGVDPGDDRPIAAEAECLESMRRYAAALDARNRALAVAATGAHRWETLHYRWRLHYWLGDLDAAAADLAACVAYDPNSIFYVHVYPALLDAERDDLFAARQHADALAAEPAARDVLWASAILRLLGQPDRARTLLAQRAAEVDYTAALEPSQDAAWLQALYDYCRGTTSLEAVQVQVDAADQPWRRWGELHFHQGVMHLARGERGAAAAAWRKAYRSFDHERGYTYHARLLLGLLEKDLAWPRWIGVSWQQRGENASASEGSSGRPQVCHAVEGD